METPEVRGDSVKDPIYASCLLSPFTDSSSRYDMADFQTQNAHGAVFFAITVSARSSYLSCVLECCEIMSCVMRKEIFIMNIRYDDVE